MKDRQGNPFESLHDYLYFRFISTVTERRNDRKAVNLIIITKSPREQFAKINR